MLTRTRRPERFEAAEYYFRYIDQVPDGDIVEYLAGQRELVLGLLRRIPASMGDRRYADDKWTLREVVGHLSDTERLFCARAFWFARGFDSPMPSFDPDAANAAGQFNDRSWGSLVDEFAAVRESTLTFFAGLPEETWDRCGIASGNPFTVRALAYLTAGHVNHHLAIVRTSYLTGG